MHEIEGERDRLWRRYRETSDTDLLDLDPANLTDEAQDALRAELRVRRLERSRPDAELSLPARETRLIADQERLLRADPDEDGLVWLDTFSDGLELSKVCAALDSGGVTFFLEVHNGDLTLGRPATFELRVEPEVLVRARAVLRDRLGYYPLQEVDGQIGMVDDGEWVTLGQFETQAEAAKVSVWLTEAGIRNSRGSFDDPDDDGIVWHWVNVRLPDLERGLVVVAERMGLKAN